MKKRQHTVTLPPAEPETPAVELESATTQPDRHQTATREEAMLIALDFVRSYANHWEQPAAEIITTFAQTEGGYCGTGVSYAYNRRGFFVGTFVTLSKPEELPGVFFFPWAEVKAAAITGAVQAEFNLV